MANGKYPGSNLAERSGRGGRGGRGAETAFSEGDLEGAAAAGRGENGSVSEAAAVAPTETELRRQAAALGMVVSRKGHRRGFRPEVSGDGKVRQTFQLEEPVRMGMEQACSQLNLGYSQFVGQALTHYFDYLGLRYEGVPIPAARGGAAGAGER